MYGVAQTSAGNGIIYGSLNCDFASSLLHRFCWGFLLPKYLFQVSGGAHVLDVEGRELPNASVARIQGIKFAGEILKDMPTVLYETAHLKIDVTDETGLVLFKVLVTTLGENEFNADSLSTPRASRQSTVDSRDR